MRLTQAVQDMACISQFEKGLELLTCLIPTEHNTPLSLYGFEAVHQSTADLWTRLKSVTKERFDGPGFEGFDPSSFRMLSFSLGKREKSRTCHTQTVWCQLTLKLKKNLSCAVRGDFQV